MKNYKHAASILLFLFFTTALFSQGIHIKGLVLSEDSSPVPYATLYDGSQKSGTFSDSLGRYSIYMPDNVRELHISAIGYKSKTITVDSNDNLSDFHIVLQNDTFKLKEVVISSKTFKPKQVELGPEKKIKGGIGLCSQLNRQTGLYIPNPEQIHGEIKSVEVYLEKKSDETNYLIRLRIFSVDENLYPANDLLLDNVILQVKKSKRDQLVKIDLEKYHIPFLSNGIVVALEVVQNTQELYPSGLKAQSTREEKCTSLKTVLNDDNTIGFVLWDRVDNGKWYKINFADYSDQVGYKLKNRVPYVKLTINEYAD